MWRQKIMVCLAFFLWVSGSFAQETHWIQYDGEEGPGKGKKVVLISGDEEYRSEEACAMLGKILAKRHGFTCVVLFAIQPRTGEIDPTVQDNIPGMEHLADADLCVMATRFRNLPDEQMKFFVEYVEAGKPFVGLRTATHAFAIPADRKYARYSFNAPAASGWEQGFGRQILGETWIAHHGEHGVEGTRSQLVPESENHPILRGYQEIFVPTDVYRVRLPLPGDSRILLFGEVTASLEPDSPAVLNAKNEPKMPIAWVKSYVSPQNPSLQGRVFTTTMGAAVDLQSEGLRRLLVNGVYWACGLEAQIPAQANVDWVDSYHPTWFGFGKHRKGKKPADFSLGKGIGL
ncbi:MAG: ThuA domain-containing protein [Planctomycetia bacterium]|nr:ThuA domain-containing protein [Planctomycetia bacterium]